MPDSLNAVLPSPDLARKAMAALASPPGTVKLQYRVTLITPMFGGGVSAGEPDTAMPFRANGIRGSLRHWWRLMARAGDFDDLVSPALSAMPPKALRGYECQLWGGVAVAGRPTRSRVVAKVCGWHVEPTFTYDEYDSRVSDLGYLLFPAKKEQGRPAKELLPAGGWFDLEIECGRESDVQMVARLLDMWSTFGGLGARTRRGIGAVEVSGTAGHTLCVLSPNSGWQTTAFSRFCIGRATYSSARAALAAGARAYGQFRVQEPYARRPKSSPKGRPGQSYWPEGDVIRRATGLHLVTAIKQHPPRLGSSAYFPRASFGLPMAIYFVKDQVNRPGNVPTDTPDWEPAPRTLNPPNADRMASPLILRPVAFPVGDSGVEYRIFAGILRRDEANPWLQEVSVTPPAGALARAPIWNDRWRVGRGEANCEDIRPLGMSQVRPSGSMPEPTNAVEAFLNYFQNLYG